MTLTTGMAVLVEQHRAAPQLPATSVGKGVRTTVLNGVGVDVGDRRVPTELQATSNVARANKAAASK